MVNRLTLPIFFSLMQEVEVEDDEDDDDSMDNETTEGDDQVIISLSSVSVGAEGIISL